jgi:hypothetical protein
MCSRSGGRATTAARTAEAVEAVSWLLDTDRDFKRPGLKVFNPFKDLPDA